MIDFLKRTWAQINLDAIQHNYEAIKASLSDGCRVMAVVKADAYGHGAGFVSRTLRDAGVSWFGVSNLDEALQIRDEGIAEPILILAYTPPGQAEQLAANNITQTVFERSYAEQLSQAAVKAGVTVRVHIKLDTGMSRIGFFCQGEQGIIDTVDEVERVCGLPGLYPEGIFTHFASADEKKDDEYTLRQFERFLRVTEGLTSRGIKLSIRHCCNSAATMRFRDMHLDMVRPGIILYGLVPSPWMDGILPLQPAMELKTVVSMTKTVPDGTSVSYGRTFNSKHDTTIATLPIGYADGYPRVMSNRAHMLVCGRRVPVIGRVCMDQCLLDVTGIDGVREGSTVTVFGKDGDECIPVEEFAALQGTINYETVCLIGKRVPRIFRKGGQDVGKLNYIRI
jgi:alanine racemase